MGTERDQRRPRKQRRKVRGQPGNPSRTPEQAELAIEQRRARATQLRVEGHSIREIAVLLKHSVGTIHKDLAAVLLRTYDGNDDRVRTDREISLRRLDVAARGLMPAVKKGEADSARALVRVEHRRASLQGLDAPTAYEHRFKAEVEKLLDEVRPLMSQGAYAELIGALAQTMGIDVMAEDAAASSDAAEASIEH